MKSSMPHRRRRRMIRRTRQPAPDKRFLTIEEVAGLAGVSVAEVWRRMKAGDFPKPIENTTRRRWSKLFVEEAIILGRMNAGDCGARLRNPREAQHA